MNYFCFPAMGVSSGQDSNKIFPVLPRPLNVQPVGAWLQVLARAGVLGGLLWNHGSSVNVQIPGIHFQSFAVKKFEVVLVIWPLTDSQRVLGIYFSLG